MSIPLSLLWIGDSCGGADLDENGNVGLSDLKVLLDYWLETGCITSDGCGKANLDNSDNLDVVILLDFAVIAQFWLFVDC